jgi:aldehyde dehydrogenase (NAD+)
VSVTTAPLDVVPSLRMLIGTDHLTASSLGEIDHIYPATGEPTARVLLAGAEEMDRAVQAAHEALPIWLALGANRRRELLARVAELITERAPALARLQTMENGTPSVLAQQMPHVTADLFWYNAGWVDKIGGSVVSTWPVPALDYTLDEPYGVVALIIPWNGPLVSVGMTAAPALAAGNTLVLKPPELAPFTSLAFGEICQEVGIPPGVVNVVPGGSEGGAALVRHPGIGKVHFTGSGATAQRVLAGALENLTPVGLELGGKSASLIFDDADLLPAAQQAVGAITMMSGQGCINGTRLFVQWDIYDAVLDLARDIANNTSVGDPALETTTMGPVINESAADRICGVIDRAQRDSSGRLVAGGKRMGGEFSAGFFVEPTIFVDVDNSSALAQQEIFGPVLSVMRFETEEEAVRLANDTAYGLAGYIHTNDLRRAHRVAAGLTAGNIWINGYTGIPPGVPFGGTKQSGFGRLGGIEGIREFSRSKNIWCAM